MMNSTSTMTARKPRLAVAVSFVHVLLLAAGAVDATFIHHDPCKQYEAATLSVLNKVIWPTSRNIAVSGVAPPEFSKDVNGRIVPVGTFETNLGALEYFYRLAGPLELNDTTSNRVDSLQIRWMDCDAKKKQVAFESLFHLSNPAIPQVANYSISAMGIFTFDKDGKVCAYDWDLRRLGLVVEASLQYTIKTFYGGNITAFYDARRSDVCDIAKNLCLGNNTQYSSKEECLKFLNSIPVGDWDRADQANLVCRILHSYLVPIRPAVHFPHIGPTGGGKCVDNPVSTLFTQDFSKCASPQG